MIQKHAPLMALMVGMVCGPAVFAAPPKFTSLLPAGGQIGTTVEVELIGSAGTNPLKAVAFNGLTQPSDQLEWTADEKGKTAAVIISAEASPGIHWVRFQNDEGASKLLPFCVGTIGEQIEAEPNDRLSEAGEPVILPAVANGILKKSHDVDSFPVSLEAGQQLVAALIAQRILNSPMDAVLQIVDEQGFVQAQNHDHHGEDPLICWTAPRDGTFFVRVFAFPSKPNSSVYYHGGNDYVYRLTLTTGPYLSACLPKDSLSGTTPKLIGWNFADASDLNAQDVPGLHQITAERFNSLAVAEYNSERTPLELNGGLAFFGHIDESTADAYPLSLKSGTNLRLRVSARQIDSQLDPVLTIERDGKSLKQFDDIKRGEIDIDSKWKVPSDGVYSFVVSDRYDSASPQHTYLLEVEESKPYVELATLMDHYEGQAGKPLDFPIAIKREAGFAETISFRIDGLSDQQSVELTPSEPKGDSAKFLKLKITNNSAERFQGLVQVIGLWGDGQEQAVTAQLNPNGYTTDRFLLTLPGKPQEKPE